MTYDELVKDLRYCASTECTCGECKHNNEMCCETMLLEQAADAIENISKAYQMMAEAYEAEVTKQDWIPVTERLPEKYGTYLVTTKRGSVMVGCYYPKAQNWNIRATAAYWMPLPEPPKEET